MLRDFVRPALLSLVLVFSTVPAFAGDARVDFLSKQLKSASDPRVRAQTVVLLGKSASADAVVPLCTALADKEAVVRTAAAGALGELRMEASLKCLKAAPADKDATVKSAIDKALALTPLVQGGLYISLETLSEKKDVPAEVQKLADDMLRSKLAAMGAAFAPSNEPKPAAAALVKSHKLRGFMLKVNLQPHKDTGLKIEMLIMTYPDQSLQGTWNVKAAGGKPESLLKLMVPRVVDDAATDLEWKQ